MSRRIRNEFPSSSSARRRDSFIIVINKHNGANYHHPELKALSHLSPCSTGTDPSPHLMPPNTHSLARRTPVQLSSQ